MEPESDGGFETSRRGRATAVPILAHSEGPGKGSHARNRPPCSRRRQILPRRWAGAPAPQPRPLARVECPLHNTVSVMETEPPTSSERRPDAPGGRSSLVPGLPAPRRGVGTHRRRRAAAGAARLGRPRRSVAHRAGARALPRQPLRRGARARHRPPHALHEDGEAGHLRSLVLARGSTGSAGSRRRSDALLKSPRPSRRSRRASSFVPGSASARRT